MPLFSFCLELALLPAHALRLTLQGLGILRGEARSAQLWLGSGGLHEAWPDAEPWPGSDLAARRSSSPTSQSSSSSATSSSVSS